MTYDRWMHCVNQTIELSSHACTCSQCRREAWACNGQSPEDAPIPFYGSPNYMCKWFLIKKIARLARSPCACCSEIFLYNITSLFHSVAICIRHNISVSQCCNCIKVYMHNYDLDQFGSFRISGVLQWIWSHFLTVWALITDGISIRGLNPQAPSKYPLWVMVTTLK